MLQMLIIYTCYSSPLKAGYDFQKKQHRQEWLNTPNSYRREEVEETGTPNPKKVTKVR